MNASCICCRGALSRRGLLGGVVAAAATSFRAAAQSTLSPAAALQALVDGNKRYVDQKLTSFGQDLAVLRRNTEAKQEPFAAVLSCADSRVPVELVFDRSIGELFVTRVAGNVASPDIIASLEYGAAVLGTRAIMVLGHSGCGAVKATMDGKAVPGQISALYAPIRPAVEAAGGDLTAAIKANAKIQANLLATASPVLAGAIKDGKLTVVAGYYDLGSGAVSVLGVAMTDAEFDSPDFLALLRGGDEGAYRVMIRRFHGSLVGVAGGIIGSRAQAEEVVQDAWLAVFSNIARFEGRSSLASWLFTIVLNRARTRAQREGRLTSLPAGLDGDERAVPRSEFAADGHWREAPRLWDVLDPERIVAGRQLWVHVQEAIERLPAGQKAVLILRDIEGNSAEDACALLQLSAENQRVLLHRARGRIRRAIDLLTGAPQPVAAAARTVVGKPGGSVARRLAAALRAWWPAPAGWSHS